MRILSRLSILSVVTVLCLLCLHQGTAQQQSETPAEQVVPPINSDGNEIPPDETADSAMDEPERPSPGAEAFQRAMQHEEKNELEEAIADCTEAIELEPDNVEYLNGRAHLYGEMRNKEKAIADAEKVFERDPTNVRARVLRGRMLELSGDPEKALTEFNTAVEQNPSSLQALSERQYYFIRQGQSDKAMADANRMVQLQPDSATGNMARALSGTRDETMTFSSAAIQQDPDNWFAYKLRGLSRAANGDFVEAMGDFDKALELSPNNALIFSARGAMYYMQGDYAKSLVDSQKAAELEPRNGSILAILADRLATCPDSNMRNGAKASEYAAEALRLNANEPLVWRACASAAAVNGNFEEAKKWQERLLNSNIVSQDQEAESRERLVAYNSGKPYVQNLPPVEEVLADKKIKQANEAIRNKNFDRAIVLLSEVIRGTTKKAKVYTDRGFAYLQQNKYDLAAADFNEAIEIDNKYSEAYFYRARVFSKKQKYAEALNDFLTVEKLDPPTSSDVRNSLAWLFATCPDDHVRDRGKAAEYVDRALELDPGDSQIWDTCAAVFAENGDFEDAVDWENAYLERNDITDVNRRGGAQRLALYQERKPYHQEPDKPEQPDQLTASTTPMQSGK